LLRISIVGRLVSLTVLLLSLLFILSCQKDELKINTQTVESDIRSNRDYSGNNEFEENFFDVNYVSEHLRIDSLSPFIGSDLSIVLDRMYLDENRTQLISPLYENNQYPCWNCAEAEYVDRLTFYIPVYDLSNDKLSAMLWARFDDNETNIYYLSVDYIESLSRSDIKIYKYWNNLANYFDEVGNNEKPNRNDFFVTKRSPCEIVSTTKCNCDINYCSEVIWVQGFPVCEKSDCEVEDDPPTDGEGGGGSSTPTEDPYDDEDVVIPDGPGSCYFCSSGAWGEEEYNETNGGGDCNNCSDYSVDERQEIISNILNYIDENHPSIYVPFSFVLVMSNNSQFDHTTAVLADHLENLDKEELEAYIMFVSNHPQFLEDESETIQLLYNEELTLLLNDFLPTFNEEDYVSNSVGHIIIDLVQEDNLSIGLSQLFDNAERFVELQNDFALMLNNQEVEFLLTHGNVISEIRLINESDTEGSYAAAASNLYISIAALDMLDLTISEVQANLDLQILIHGHMQNHQLGAGPGQGHLAVSATIWYTIFQTDAYANGGGISDWLKSIKDSIKEGWNELLQPVAEYINEVFSSLPSTADEWYVLGGMLAPILGEILIDFIPIVGDVKGFADAFDDIANDDYAMGALGIVSSLAGILPIGDLLKSIPKIKDAFSLASGAFTAMKGLVNVSADIFKHIKDYVKNGFEVIWDNTLGKLKLFNGADEVGDLSEAMAKAIDLLSGLPVNKQWVKLNDKLLMKMANVDEVTQNLVNLFYTTFVPSSVFTPPTIIDDIEFNRFGFPDFKPHAPTMPDGSRSVFNAADHPNGFLSGTGTDMTQANNWALLKYGSGNFEKLSNGQCKIKKYNPDGTIEWVTHTWHHFEDGRNMFPVPTEIHDVIHTGGASVIDKGIEDFFDPLIF